MVRPAVVAQQLPGKHDVVGSDRHAVGKMRGRIEGEGDVASRIVGFDRSRQQAVERERLVVAARHQAFDYIAADRLQRVALDDQRIEAVESAEHALDDAAAFRRIRIGIGHGREIVRQSRRAMHGDGVSRRGVSRRQTKAGTKAGKHNRAAKCGPRCIAGAAGFWSFHPGQKR